MSGASASTLDRDCFEFLTVPDAYRDLQQARVLLCQTDPKLYSTGIALPSGEGGMCAAVNALNAFRAVLNFTGRDFIEAPFYYLQAMLQHLRLEQIDGRLGLYDESTAIGLDHLASVFMCFREPLRKEKMAVLR